MVATAATDPACHPALGVRRRPEQTVLHRVVREELRAFVSRRREPGGDGLPRFVEGELERYLECGLLPFGFLRVKCTQCKVERLVAFSCKGRGVCPSCGARRMTDTAARLVDRVLPEANYRQWVLTVPFAMRYRLASDTAELTRVLKLFHRCLRAELRTRARKLGLTPGEPAAVTVIQRFGGALNLHVHFHVIVAEALFAKAGAIARQIDLPPPSNSDVERVLARLVRKLHADVAAPVGPSSPALDRAQQHSMLSTLALVPRELEPETRARRRCARLDGFTLHANVFIPRERRDALERLCRYAARPSFSLSRLSEREGKVAYQLKRPLANGARELLLEKDTFLERLAALVPPPRANLVRYHGVLAPGCKRRRYVVPTRPSHGVPRAGRMDWASLLWRVYKVDAFTCAACGGKARVLAAIRDREVIKKILRHLKLSVNAPVILPARAPSQLELSYGEVEREVELDEEVLVERLPAWMREAPKARHRLRREGRRRGRPTREGRDDEAVSLEELPAWMRAGPEPVRATAEAADDVDEVPDVSRLPRWMRSAGDVTRAPPARTEWDFVDELPSVENLPPWMRVPRPRRKVLARWDTRTVDDDRRLELYPDESPRMELLPGWMRGGWLALVSRSPATSWDQVDLPGPEDVAEELGPEEPVGSDVWDGVDEVYPDNFAQPSYDE